ncbi:MAG TPA: DUF4258 domain-containing protein [Conexibacter sp.]|jgi:hypothetical protein|nr:DUF4258 domain-containing protein [Conexibacter sp.]
MADPNGQRITASWGGARNRGSRCFCDAFQPSREERDAAYKITPADVGAVVSAPTTTGLDARGNSRLTGPDANGRAIIVVVADDDPDFVITTFPDD